MADSRTILEGPAGGLRRLAERTLGHVLGGERCRRKLYEIVAKLRADLTNRFEPMMADARTAKFRNGTDHGSISPRSVALLPSFESGSAKAAVRHGFLMGVRCE